MSETTVKICVVGPAKSGKTLLCKALAEQPLSVNEYHPTAAVRIQEVSKTIGVDRVKVQFWDCSGNSQYQPYWPVLSKDIDGVLLIIDCEHPEQEKELESFYLNFAQPNNLTVKQCMVMAIQTIKEGSYGLPAWSGLKGKLSKLPNCCVSINPAAPGPGVQEANSQLDSLFMGCLQQKKENMERSVVDE